MIQIFKRKSNKEKLYERYIKLLNQAKEYSTKQPQKSEKLFAETNRLFQQMQYLN